MPNNERLAGQGFNKSFNMERQKGGKITHNCCVPRPPSHNHKLYYDVSELCLVFQPTVDRQCLATGFHVLGGWLAGLAIFASCVLTFRVRDSSYITKYGITNQSSFLEANSSHYLNNNFSMFFFLGFDQIKNHFKERVNFRPGGKTKLGLIFE